MKSNTPKDQIELMKRAEFKPITSIDLQKNEYFDVHAADLNVSEMTAEQIQEQIKCLEDRIEYSKQKPYKLQLKGGDVGKPRGNNDDSDDDVETEAGLVTVNDLEDTFFVLINKERRTIQPGEQVFNNYGNHTNRYLLVHYGFCLADNRYDTYELRMRVDLSSEEYSCVELIDFLFQCRSVEKYFLKRDKICEELVGYLRALCKQSFYRRPNQMVKKPNAMQNLFLMQDVMLSTPSDLLYEAYVFEQYLLILERIDQRMNSQTTLEEDLKLLSDDELHWKMRMSVTYRVGKKQLIRSQINIVKKTLDVITTVKELLDTEQMNADTNMQNKAYTDLLLLETTYEQQQKKEAMIRTNSTAV